MNYLIFFFLLLSTTALAQKSPQDFIWKNRLLIVNAPFSQEFWQQEGLKEQLNERKLVVFWFEDSQLVKSNFEGKLNPKLFLDRIPEGSAWILIGLDGGVKASGKRSPNLEELSKIIDAMPMRIRERNGNFCHKIQNIHLKSSKNT